MSSNGRGTKWIDAAAKTCPLPRVVRTRENMASEIIAAVPINDREIVVWFEGGISKRYAAKELGMDEGPALSSVRVAHDGTELLWGKGERVPINLLESRGDDVDYVSTEKQRLLKSLSSIRRESSFSQTRLGEAAGIRQSVISRIEGCEISPQINTLLKLLTPLGKTLAIVDLEDK